MNIVKVKMKIIISIEKASFDYFNLDIYYQDHNPEQSSKSFSR